MTLTPSERASLELLAQTMTVRDLEFQTTKVKLPAEARKIFVDELAERKRRQKIADQIDGYDRDDLGESPDY